MKTAIRVSGLYARVSSDGQARERTIESQLAELHQRALADGVPPPPELVFCDDGYTGSTLVRPALERLRDVVAAGAVDRLYVHSPDRLAREFAHQILLIDECHRAGVEVVFLNYNVDDSPEGKLLLQIQGVIAQYERAKILERSRRGRLHAAQSGAVSVLSGAPYGYRYITKSEGEGRADYRILLEQARVVRQIFEWVGRERCSLREVVRRLRKQGTPTRTGKPVWEPATLVGMLKNPAYKGMAAVDKTHRVERRPRLRPRRGQSEFPRRNSCAATPPRGTDTDPGPGDRGRRDLRRRSGAVGPQPEAPRPPSPSRALLAPGALGLCPMRACVLRGLLGQGGRGLQGRAAGAVLRVLSLLWHRRGSLRRQPRLYQPDRPYGSPRCGGVGRRPWAAVGSWSNRGRIPTPPGASSRGRRPQSAEPSMPRSVG